MGSMTTSAGPAVVDWRRGCDTHLPDNNNSEKATICTQNPHFLEVTTTLTLRTKTAEASDKQPRWLKTCVTMDPSSHLGLREATNRIEARHYSVGLGLPTEAVARIEIPGIGHRGQNAGSAAGGPNAVNQGVSVPGGLISQQLFGRRTKHKEEYIKPKKPTLVDIQEAHYLSITGQGAPGGDAFVQKVGALYGVAFTVKMRSKFAGQDYVVAKLEGLWWGSKEKHDFMDEPRETWNWKLLIRTPEFITKNNIAEAVDVLISKGKDEAVREVNLEKIHEGQCVQVLHVGGYDQETVAINGMTKFAEENGLVRSGYHHEIYLADPNKTDPAKLKTILRQPVKKK